MATRCALEDEGDESKESALGWSSEWRDGSRSSLGHALNESGGRSSFGDSERPWEGDVGSRTELLAFAGTIYVERK